MKSKIDLKSFLNPEQIKAVTSLNSPLLVIAGAGSGKTRVITYRIAYLVENGVHLWNILAVTFTNKAADEMKNRVQNILGQNIKLNIGTFHSICVRILRAEINIIGFGSDFIIYDESDQVTLVKRICRELNLDSKIYRPKNIVSKISSAKNRLIAIDDGNGGYYDETIKKIYDIYIKKLKSNNAVDFDDIILLVVEIFQKYPEILAKYQERFQHILVDEYQDTNHAQHSLIRLLAKDGCNLCVVGDPDQSIYRWRGADIMNILEFEMDYKTAKIIRLEQNYRSTQTILTAANSVIGNNQEREKKILWSENDIGDPVGVYRANNERGEAGFVVNAVEELMLKQNYKYSDFVIFYRTHAQSRVFEEVLRSSKVPYDIVGGVSFYDRKEVKDIIAYLRLIVCPSDSVSLLRVINVPARGIGKTAIETIFEIAEKRGKTFNQTVWDSATANELPERILSKVRRFALLIDKYRSLAEKLDTASLIKKLIEEIKYFDELKKEEEISAETRIENIGELVSAARQFVLSGEDTSLDRFLESITLVSEIDQWNESQDKLTLMTLHCAKGLEFDVVIMVGMEEGLFPHTSSMDDYEELEEERRLCYVGMTRAKKRLFMFYAYSRMLYGRQGYCMPSRFLDEISWDLKQAAGRAEDMDRSCEYLV